MSADQLALATDTLKFPKAGVAKFTAHGLLFSESASDTDILAVGHRLLACKGVLNWALGSLFAEMIRRRPPKQGSMAESDLGWVSEFCDAHHIDPKLRREYLGVYLFYRGCTGIPIGMSFEMCREAMWGADNGTPGALARALAYLVQANTDSLSLSGLRLLIRGAQRTAPHEQREIELAAYSAVFDFARLAKRELPLVASYTPERARAILSDLGSDTLAYFDALRARAASSEPRQNREKSLRESVA